MLSNDVRKLFKRGKLYERENKDYTVIYYENPVIRVERIFHKWVEKEQVYSMIFNLYFDYEFDWTPLSNRQIAKLLGVSYQTVNNAINEILKKGREVLTPTVVHLPSPVCQRKKTVYTTNALV